MQHEATHHATQLLKRVNSLDDTAAAELLPLVYDRLRELAAGYMKRERVGHTLQPTALVHEAYFKLIDQRGIEFRDRSHFLAVAARAMRQVLVERARRHNTAKRGDGWARVTLDSAAPTASDATELLAIHDALERLAERDERLAKVVEMRFFGGLTIEETARALEVSHTTIENDWSIARAWLSRELAETETDPNP